MELKKKTQTHTHQQQHPDTIYNNLYDENALLREGKKKKTFGLGLGICIVLAVGDVAIYICMYIV